MSAREWTTVMHGAPQDIPVLWPIGRTYPPAFATCRAIHWDGYVCTRVRGHSGRHAAAGVDRIEAVWSGGAS